MLRYQTIDSPVGPLTIVVGDTGGVRATGFTGDVGELLPLSGVTHMTSQEVVAENLLLLQLDFLRRSLGLSS